MPVTAPRRDSRHLNDGLEVESEMLQTAWRLPLRKLVVAMPLTCVIVALATHALTDFDWAECFLLGALLSPTDPVLSSSVVTNPRVPRVVRPLSRPCASGSDSVSQRSSAGPWAPSSM